MTITGPLPLIIGTTGHRDLRAEDRTQLRSRVASVLNAHRTRLPHTPIVVLSALADGADRLVAEVALENGCLVVAPLPMPADAYRATMAGEAERADFDRLLARCETVFVAPPLNAREAEAQHDADFKFANCGAFIASRCFELLALWDGDAPKSLAGTAQMVEFKLEGVAEPIAERRSDLDPRLTGPVVHVVTPRASNPNPIGKPFAAERLYPNVPANETAPEKSYEQALEHIELFNADAIANGYTAGDGLASARVRDLTERLAQRYQRRTLRSMGLILAFVLAAAVFFNIYTGGLVTAPEALAGYFVLTLAAFGVFRYGRSRAWQDRYQDYRSLSEALRVAEYWRRAGIAAPVADEVERLQRGEISWLPSALRTLLEPPGEPPPSARLPQLREIYEGWIADQAAWYPRRVLQRRRYTRLTAYVAAVAVICAEILTLLVSIAGGIHGHRLGQILLFASGILAVTAAMIQYYGDKRGWSEEAKQYARVGALFARARERMAPLLATPHLDAAAASRIRRLIYELGQEALRENIAWRNLHRQRPIKLPHA